MSKVLSQQAQRRSVATFLGFAIGGAALSITAAKKMGLLDAVDQLMGGIGEAKEAATAAKTAERNGIEEKQNREEARAD